jgi:hypothetical protein
MSVMDRVEGPAEDRDPGQCSVPDLPVALHDELGRRQLAHAHRAARVHA